MSENTHNVIFFDIGGTLGSPRISPFPYRLEGLDVYPYVLDILRQLRERNSRIGIISNIGDDKPENVTRVLEKCQIYDLFDSDLIIYGAKNSSEIFQFTARQAGHSDTPNQCLFVGEDSHEQSYAIQAGWRVVPHPCLVWDVLNGSHLRYIRITVPSDRSEQGWQQVIKSLPVVPLYVTGDKGNQVYAIATSQAAMRLDDLGFAVDRLGSEDDPLTTEVYLVTAHLDSTAASDRPYDAKNDPAPGADDDASGVAAVLGLAEVIKELNSLNPSKRTIRFVPFNAEEHGLVGSQAYARTQAAIAAPIVGVYQMDMIGYNIEAPRSFEVHVGYAKCDNVQQRSLVLAQRLERLVSVLSPRLEHPQIYTQPDPAEGRSDHASFHQRGYAACITSEDFFVGPDLTSPEAEPNVNYHRKEDNPVLSLWEKPLPESLSELYFWVFGYKFQFLLEKKSSKLD
ncbi:MAG: M20/M25/M40 family metallo-hydrolase [Nostoc sp.]|uniref:M20/M25/M40 family metallo-hydrolase n=1 Tax=Nostoc sp. TaxID=1180 RepID=UPI002FF58EB0